MSDAALDPRHITDPGFGIGIGPNATIAPVEHPAKYSAPILELLDLLADDIPGPILDPFAGTGRIHQLHRDDTVGIEIEPEWATMHPRTIVGDATALPFPDNTFGAIITSPTYRIALGHDLHPNNTGGLQWGPDYRGMHARAWSEAVRVLAPGGAFILNISDHIRAGERQHVTSWHIDTLLGHNLDLVDYHRIDTARQRHGANSNARVDHEAVIVLRKPTA